MAKLHRTIPLIEEEVSKRIRFAPRSAIGAIVIIGLSLIFAGWLFFRGSPKEINVSPDLKVEPNQIVQEVVVDVAGKVQTPGVYNLPTGSRVKDAIAAAGGPLGIDLSSINQAAVLVDGMQISVGSPKSDTKLVSINFATEQELDSLPGIGPVMAQRIVAFRSLHGSFKSIDQLKQVAGMGESKFSNLKSMISL
jgi:comEA protein